MNKKPKIYAFCDAGCKWETVHKDDFSRSATWVKQYPDDDGTYNLPPLKSYKINSRDVNVSGAYDCVVSLEYATTGGTPKTYTFTISEYDEYRDYFFFEILSLKVIGSTALTIVYEVNGNRYSELIAVGTSINIENAKLSIVDAEDVYLFNVDASISVDSAMARGTGINSIIGNDFTSNQAISENAVAFGSGNLAGLKGYYWSDIDFTNKTITIATAHTGGAPLTECGYAVGDTLSIVNDVKYDYCCKIKAINGGVITVDNIPFTTVVAGDTDWDSYVVFCVDKPTIGLVDIGIVAFATGEDNKASNSHAFVSGRGNQVIGEYGAGFGRDNIVGYVAFVAGRGNKYYGQAGAMLGQSNKGTGNRQFSFGYGNEHNSGNDTVAIGMLNNLNNVREWTIGRYNALNGTDNFAFGTRNNTKNNQIVAIGFDNSVDSEGVEASDSAFAFGHNINITRKHSIGLGRTIIIKHYGVSALGLGLISMASFQSLFGAYNATDNKMGEAGAIRVTGAGTSASDRKTVETLSKNGDLKLTGSITLDALSNNPVEITAEDYSNLKESAEHSVQQATTPTTNNFYNASGTPFIYGHLNDGGTETECRIPLHIGGASLEGGWKIPLMDEDGTMYTGGVVGTMPQLGSKIVPTVDNVFNIVQSEAYTIVQNNAVPIPSSGPTSGQLLQALGTTEEYDPETGLFTTVLNTGWVDAPASIRHWVATLAKTSDAESSGQVEFWSTGTPNSTTNPTNFSDLFAKRVGKAVIRNIGGSNEEYFVSGLGYGGQEGVRYHSGYPFNDMNETGVLYDSVTLSELT